ncbi:SPOR domain-containing protein [Sphingomicrobium sediminis]|uniref:SPOR domain-containing protein n=1 Tax=Sphingomicrobium sediminis TaxID=2950949 RepID=A0A9X2J2Z6_9SPHN|nr:SPOR domain-containing protein [Sphingomicrobium sediminis]MCM8557560.1 SPOR domain-containing protein [Sphingomicrobium sediminis]
MLNPKSKRAPAIGAALAAVMLALAPTPATAQIASETPGEKLSRNLRVLAERPDAFDPLIGAGEAALALGDLPAAAGFYGRAADIRASDPRPLIGLGCVAVQMNDPEKALAYFADAAALGATQRDMGAGRGLAYDLLGRQREAEADYRAALRSSEGQKAGRRLALNLGMRGERDEALRLLAPLVAQDDMAAIRARAFVLAMTGDLQGAAATIDEVMPGASYRMNPFFAELPTMSPRQKAAAVHLGIFPTADRIERVSTPTVPTSPVREPAGPPAPRPVATVDPEAQNLPEGWQVSTPDTEVAEAQNMPEGWAVAEAEPAAPPPIPQVTVREAPVRSEEVRAVDIPAVQADRFEAERRGQQAAATPSRDTRLANLDSVLASIETDDEATPLGKSEGAAGINPPPAPMPKYDAPPAPRPKVEAPRPAAPAAAPAPDIGVEGRWFVQLAGSDNASAMAFEYRRIRGRAPGLLGENAGLVTRGVEFHRLLVGPFSSRADAQARVNQLKAEGVDAFVWSRDPAALKIDRL